MTSGHPIRDEDVLNPQAACCPDGEEPKTYDEEVGSAFEHGKDRHDLREKVYACLRDIFMYYSVQGRAHEPCLNSTRFQRMALDANLVGGKLLGAKVDLIFHHVCSGSPHMSLQQFLDAIVQVAVAKYPSMSSVDAIVKIYEEKLSSFTSSQGAFQSIPQETLEVIGAAKPGLKPLYEGYFKKQLQSWADSSLSEAQSQFSEVLADFEVTPSLAPKSIGFSVFREVNREPQVPEMVLRFVLGEGSKNLGKPFTYAHFAVALAMISKRCFADAGAASFLRFLDWMDSSRGRVKFLSSSPWHLPAGGIGAFKLKPDNLPATGCVASSVPQAGTESTPGASQRALSAPASRAALNDGRPNVKCAQREDKENPVELSEMSRRIIQEIFGHYASISDPLNRTSLSDLKFSRFMRDCGLVPSEIGAPVLSGSGSPMTAFSPPERTSSEAPRSVMMSRGGKESQNQRPVAFFRRDSGVRSGLMRSPSSPQRERARERQQDYKSLSVSRSRDLGPGRPGEEPAGLPLHVFPTPPLSIVDADLIFVQVVTGLKLQARASGGRSGSRVRARAGAAGNRGAQEAIKSFRSRSTVKHMPLEGFIRTLVVIASRCFPEHASSAQAMEELCTRVLTPLSELLLNTKDEDVIPAVQIMEMSETQRLFEMCASGLEKIFNHYAHHDANTKGSHWTCDYFLNFAADFEITAEMSYMPLRKIFADCAHWESCNAGGVEGNMSLEGFKLGIIMIAEKLHGNQSLTPCERLTILFSRMNSIAATSRYGAGLVGPQHEILITLPSPSPSARIAAGSCPREKSQSGGPRTRRGSSHTRSWKEVAKTPWERTDGFLDLAAGRVPSF